MVMFPHTYTVCPNPLSLFYVPSVLMNMVEAYVEKYYNDIY
jgi:hypothetical protein